LNRGNVRGEVTATSCTCGSRLGTSPAGCSVTPAATAPAPGRALAPVPLAGTTENEITGEAEEGEIAAEEEETEGKGQESATGLLASATTETEEIEIGGIEIEEIGRGGIGAVTEVAGVGIGAIGEATEGIATITEVATDKRAVRMTLMIIRVNIIQE